MNASFLSFVLENLDSDLFCWGDIMTVNFQFEFMVDKNQRSNIEIVKENVSDTIVSILCAGEVPSLNPSFISAADENGVLDVNKLNEAVAKNCTMKFSDLDVNNFYCHFETELQLLFVNMRMLSNNEREKINRIKIKSFLGEFNIENETE